MREKLSIVRWMPPLPNMRPVETESATKSMRMQEWLIPTDAVIALQRNGAVSELLSLCNELEIDRVLHGAELEAVQSYLRFKAARFEAGRIVTTDIR